MRQTTGRQTCPPPPPRPTHTHSPAASYDAADNYSPLDWKQHAVQVFSIRPRTRRGESHPPSPEIRSGLLLCAPKASTDHRRRESLGGVVVVVVVHGGLGTPRPPRSVVAFLLVLGDAKAVHDVGAQRQGSLGIKSPITRHHQTSS